MSTMKLPLLALALLLLVAGCRENVTTPDGIRSGTRVFFNRRAADGTGSIFWY